MLKNSNIITLFFFDESIPGFKIRLNYGANGSNHEFDFYPVLGDFFFTHQRKTSCHSYILQKYLNATTKLLFRAKYDVAVFQIKTF